MDRERMLEVRDRIDRKIMEQIDPKDLFYQILDGLRSLTHYDHSSALLIRENSEDALRVVAEQIAWTKAKSERIGLTLPLDDDVRADPRIGRDPWLRSARGRLARVVRQAGGAAGGAAGLQPRRLGETPGRRRRRSDRGSVMLCAPLVTRDGIFGVLKVAGRHPGRLRPFDAELVDRFRSQAAVAIQNLTRTESLQARLLTAERRHAIAELARTVAARREQRARVDAAARPADAGRSPEREDGRPVYLQDLEQVQKSLQVCRRIFGGMLSFARGGARRAVHGQVRPALETSLAVLKDGMSRRGIDLVVEAPSTTCLRSRAGRAISNRCSSTSSRTRGRRAPREARSRSAFSRTRTAWRSRSPTPARASRPRIFHGLRAVLHDEGQRQRPGSVHLPIDSLGGWRHAQPPERAARGTQRPRDRALGVRARLPRQPNEKTARASWSWTTRSGMLRAVERVLGGTHTRRGQPVVGSGGGGGGASSSRTSSSSTSACPSWTGSS